MKKIYLITALIVLYINTLVNISFAVPAYPYPVQITQRDGTVLSVILRGDERVKWAISPDEYALIYNSKGVYEYAKLDARGDLVPSGVKARNVSERGSKDKVFLNSVRKNLIFSPSQVSAMKQISAVSLSGAPEKAFPTSGSHKLICILIGYPDLPFTKTQTDFQNLFNQVGYTADGATGSVKDFFSESSYNQLNLTVDVAGPFMADNPMAYYGANDASGNDIRPRELVTEAVLKADPTVNYADYDNDGDGNVDGVYVIFAGYGEETGASADCIWSHAWNITPVTCDGKVVSRYSCSPELRANSGTGLARIGVICHEFGHILGAPDFYDTDYATGGQYLGTGNWDLQAGGSWNGDWGATPAQSNPYTKVYIYNWATATTLSNQANITLQPAGQNSNSFYRFNTATTNEYFLLENRQQLGFDADVPGHGLMIYHVNKDIANGSINSTHPQMMYPVCASATSEPNSTPSSYGAINSSSCPYPGTSNIAAFSDFTIPSQKSWAGEVTGKPISNITENILDHTISLCFMGCSTLPMSYISSTATQNNTSNAFRDQTNQEILGIQIVTNGGLTPLSATSFTFNTSGSTNPVTDISNAKLFYTGTGGTFASATQFGTTSIGPNGSFTITGNQVLNDGTNYFWLTYDIPATAGLGNFLDGQCTELIVGSTQTPIVTDPVGNRQIAINYCAAGASNINFEYISNVAVGSINQSSIAGSFGYQDFTSQATTMQIGTNYSATITVGIPYATDQILIWVDWNKNGSFTDPGENVYVSANNANFTTPHTTANFTPPVGATIGKTRMRIRLQDANTAPTNATPCGNSSYGEVEDYTINVTSGCVAPFAPGVGTITQPTCALATGSVVLNGLPATGIWTLTRTQGAITTSGTGVISTITGLVSGTYTYTVTDASGCTSIASANVVINAPPTTPAAPTGVGTQSFCAGSTVASLVATGTALKWYAAATGGTALATSTVLINGTHYYASQTVGCESTARLNVTATILAAPTAPNVGTITQPTCALATGSVILNGLPSTGTWTLTRTPGAVTSTGTGVSSTITGLATGTYTYTVINSSGCVSVVSANVVINAQPVQSAPIVGTITQPTCAIATGSVILSGLPASGTWTLTRTPGATVKTGTGATSTITGLATGTYTYTVKNSSGCASIASANVVINAQPSAPVAPTGSAAQSFCSGTTVASLVATGTAIKWYAAATGGTALATTTTLVNGTHYYASQTVNTCESTSRLNVTATINALPAAPAAIGGTKTVCIGKTTTLTDATTGGVWSSSSTAIATISATGVVTGVAAGSATISYKVTNGSGCSRSVTTTVTVSAIPAQPGNFTTSTSAITRGTTSYTYTVPSVSGVSYKWSYSGTGATITGTTNSVRVVYSTTATLGSLSVTASNTAGCISTAQSLAITFLKSADIPTDIQVAVEIPVSKSDLTVAKSELKVYPNPTSGQATFEFGITENAKVTLDIYSITGQHIARIFDASIDAGIKQKVLFDQSLSTGTYPCIMRWNSQMITVKLIITQ